MRESRASFTILWVTLALVAVASGWIAIHVVGDAFAPNAVPVMSDDEIDTLLATAEPPKSGAPSAQPTATGTKPPDTNAHSVSRTFRSRGGIVVASCSGTQIDLRTWSPNPGYAAEESEVKESEAEVRFESEGPESRIRVTCESGVPVGEVDDG